MEVKPIIGGIYYLKNYKEEDTYEILIDIDDNGYKIIYLPTNLEIFNGISDIPNYLRNLKKNIFTSKMYERTSLNKDFDSGYCGKIDKNLLNGLQVIFDYQDPLLTFINF